MKTNKIGVIFLMVVMALATVGTSYAMWSETITMNGSVTTGTVDIEWSLHDYWDTEIAEKDVSGFSDTSPPIISNGGNTLTITLDGVYPCIYYYLEFDIHCVGTVPVHFEEGFFGDVTTPEGELGQYLLDNGIVTITPITELQDGTVVNSGVITDPDVTQLHTCESWYGLLTFHLTNELWDDLVEDHNWQQDGGPYTFTISIMGHQYNESPDT